MTAHQPIPLAVTVDLAHGGRWTSLRTPDREWLWHRDAPQRDSVRPGDPFVDAGGLEECLPTVRGAPDHGALWSRPWSPTDSGAVVEAAGLRLHRTVTVDRGVVRASYELTGRPGTAFIWAGHALLALSPYSRLAADPGPVRLFADCADLVRAAGMPWPTGAEHWDATWPAPFGTRLDLLGPDDATAIGAILLGRCELAVTDGADTLSLSLSGKAPSGPISFALWRNLGGWPQPEPYRSIGVEPMLGRAFDIDRAGPSDVARLDAEGRLGWTLTIRAWRARS